MPLRFRACKRFSSFPKINIDKEKTFNKIVENKTPVVLALDPDMKAKTMSLAKRLHEFDIQVRILKTDGFEDVGAMSKRQFLERKMSATSWLPFDNLKFKISNLATGSII